jgi:AcrR family transcriptional regulator
MTGLLDSEAGWEQVSDMPEVNAQRRAEIGRERREKTRHKLIVAAARVIARRGDEHATIDDFIRAAGLARGTFYNYFPTREDLVEAVWSHLGKDPFLEIERLCAPIADPAERMVAVARMVLERAGRDEIWGWLIYSLSSDDQEVNEDLRAFPSPELRDGIAQGRFVFDDLESARDLVVGIVRKALRMRLAGGRTAAYDQAMCRMMLCALGLSQDEAGAVVNRPLPQADDDIRVAVA